MDTEPAKYPVMGMKEECKCPIISLYKPIKHLNEAYILNEKYNDSRRFFRSRYIWLCLTYKACVATKLLQFKYFDI